MDNESLSKIVEAIVREVDPEQVYLFGSHARGDQGEGSDLDLLVVEREPFGKGRSRRHEMVRLWRVLAGFRIPKDILVYSMDEVRMWRAGSSHIVARALSEGKLLYERR